MLVAHVFGNRCQTIIGVRKADIFRLTAIDATAQHPAAGGAVVVFQGGDDSVDGMS